jgi:hypothetical protein
MVERVIGAMKAAVDLPDDPNVHPGRFVSLEKLARAAIMEMREPTDAMIEASNQEWDGRMSHRSSGAWQAMIDEALR